MPQTWHNGLLTGPITPDTGMTGEQIALTAPIWSTLDNPIWCDFCGSEHNQAPYASGDNRRRREAGLPWHFFTWRCESCHEETFVWY